MGEASSNRFLAKRFQPFQRNPWVEVSTLAAKMAAQPGGVCNLGQGMSDMMAPDVLREAMKEVMTREEYKLHQYTRSAGHPRLVEALAKFYSKPLERDLNAYEEVMVSMGADNALACCFMGFLEAGDEVIVIEPSYDCYRGMVSVAGGVPVFVPLRRKNKEEREFSEGEDERESEEFSSDWVIDEEEFRSKITVKTKLIVVNSPQNPFGKVYSYWELAFIAEVAKQHDLVVVNDCVYEHLVYHPNPLPRIATLPGMWERTVTIGSAGKSWNVTGWKLGWAIGDACLIHCLKVVHQSLIYVCPTPIQESLAVAFERESSLPVDQTFFHKLREDLVGKRDLVVNALRKVGLKPLVPEGGYFVTVDVSTFDFAKIGVDSASTSGDEDQASPAAKLISWLLLHKRLVVMPTWPFYSAQNRRLSDNHVRICFNKTDETIRQAIGILDGWAKELNG